MSGPEDNPADEHQPTKEEWELAIGDPSAMGTVDVPPLKKYEYDIVSTFTVFARSYEDAMAQAQAQFKGRALNVRCA